MKKSVDKCNRYMLITVRKTWVIAPMSKCKKVKKSEKKC
nr:MAG TPA: hypothetical protein [Microviridae sp.]